MRFVIAASVVTVAAGAAVHFSAHSGAMVPVQISNTTVWLSLSLSNSLSGIHPADKCPDNVTCVDTVRVTGREFDHPETSPNRFLQTGTLEYNVPVASVLWDKDLSVGMLQDKGGAETLKRTMRLTDTAGYLALGRKSQLAQRGAFRLLRTVHENYLLLLPGRGQPSPAHHVVTTRILGDVGWRFLASLHTASGQHIGPETILVILDLSKKETRIPTRWVVDAGFSVVTGADGRRWIGCDILSGGEEREMELIVGRRRNINLSVHRVDGETACRTDWEASHGRTLKVGYNLFECIDQISFDSKAAVIEFSNLFASEDTTNTLERSSACL